MFELQYQDELCRIGKIGPIFASAWVKVPDAKHMVIIRDRFEERLRGPDPIGILVIGLDVRNPPSMTDAIRGDLVSVFKSGAERPGPTAAVVEAKGFIAAFLRSLFAGIFLVARGRRHNRVFGERHEAVSWMQQELGADAPADFAAAVAALTEGLA